MNAFHHRYDVYMTPTTATPAPQIGETSTPRAMAAFSAAAARLGLSRAILSSGRVRALMRFKIAWAPFDKLANLTGACDVRSFALDRRRTAYGGPLHGSAVR